jgi:DNA-binding NtrC family response regulator
VEPTNAWVVSLLARPDGPPVDALAAAGVTPVSTEHPAGGPGVLLIDQVTTEVTAAVDALGRHGQRRVLVLTASRRALTDSDTWRLLEHGAADVLAWEGRETGADVAARLRRWAEVDQLLHAPAVRERLVGQSPAWLAALRQAVEVACFTVAPMLLTGESGTGKELVARLVHELDPRPDKGELVVVDCTTVVPTLSGSEFFGHERGRSPGR